MTLAKGMRGFQTRSKPAPKEVTQIPGFGTTEGVHCPGRRGPAEGKKRGGEIGVTVETWPECQQIAEDYRSGVSASVLVGRYHHAYPAIRRFLVDSGLWRDAKDRARTRRRKDHAKPKTRMAAPVPLDEPLEYLVTAGKPADFQPMLAVDVPSGRILLDRMEEALCRVNGLVYAGRRGRP